MMALSPTANMLCSRLHSIHLVHFSKFINRSNGSQFAATVSKLTSTIPAHAQSQTRLFSEKPIIPGIGKGKTSTGIVGLPVDHDAINKIIKYNQALLDKMEASDMPETAQYRINVTKLARYRIKTCMEHPDDPEKVEELNRMGQVEELVEQAKDEMACLDMYLRERWWEQIKPVKIEFNPDRDSRDEEEESK